MSWFEAIWQWFLENREAIFGWLTSANVTGLLVAIGAVIKQHKTIKENTSSTDALKNTMKQYSQLEQKFETMMSIVYNVADMMAAFKQVLNENIDTQDKITAKLNAVLNVQQVAYAKIKDEAARNAIENIVINAKYSDAGTRAELLEEIAKLKAKGAEMAEQYQKLIEETATKMKEVTEPEVEVENKQSIPRY